MQNGGRPGLLEVLDAASRRELTTRARTVRVRKGQSVLARSEAAGDVFIVQEGRLNVVLYAADGREVSLRDLGEGQLFGELSAIDGEARSVSIVAATDARLLALAPDLFRRTVLGNPDAADWLIRRLTAQVRGLTDRVFELSALNVRTRLHCELLRLARSRAAGNETAPTHAELANRIGTHREAVTRELAALAELNIVRSGRKRLEFLDIAQLEQTVTAALRAPAVEAGWW
jgi:CRP-like cAMP-binding protein